jgi:hypothetical protein
MTCCGRGNIILKRKCGLRKLACTLDCGILIPPEEFFKYLNLTRSARRLASRAYTAIGDAEKAQKVLAEE